MFHKSRSRHLIVALASITFLGSCSLADDLKNQAESFVAKLQVNAEQVKSLVKLGGRAQQIIVARLQEAQANLAASAGNATNGIAPAPGGTTPETNLDPNLSCSDKSTGSPVVENFDACPNAEGQITYELKQSDTGETTTFIVTFSKYKEGTDSKDTYMELDGSNTWTVTIANTVISITTNENMTVGIYTNPEDENLTIVKSKGTVGYTFDIFKEELTILGTVTYTQDGQSKSLNYDNVIFNFKEDGTGCNVGPSSGKVSFEDLAEGGKTFSLTINKCADGTAVDTDGISTPWIGSELEDFFSDILGTLDSIINALNNMYREDVYGDLRQQCGADPSQDLCTEFSTLCEPPIDPKTGEPTDPNWVAPDECSYYMGYANIPPEVIGEWCTSTPTYDSGFDWLECLSIDPTGDFYHVRFRDNGSQQCSANGDEWGWMEFDPAGSKIVVHSYDAQTGLEDVFPVVFDYTSDAAGEKLVVTSSPAGRPSETVTMTRKTAYPWNLDWCPDPGAGGTPPPPPGTCQDTKEPNNINTSASYLGVLNGFQSFPGLTLQDDDWYQIDTGTDLVNNSLDVMVINYGGFAPVSVDIYDAGGTTLLATGTALASGGTTATITATKSSTFLIRIARGQNETNSCPLYDMDLDWYPVP